MSVSIVARLLFSDSSAAALLGFFLDCVGHRWTSSALSTVGLSWLSAAIRSFSLLISNGYNSWTECLSFPDFTLMDAPQTRPSVPVIKSSILASPQKPRDRSSSCTTTMSPTAMGVGLVLFAEYPCESQSSIRYSFFHLRQKWFITLQRCFTLKVGIS